MMWLFHAYVIGMVIMAIFMAIGIIYHGDQALGHIIPDEEERREAFIKMFAIAVILWPMSLFEIIRAWINERR